MKTMEEMKQNIISLINGCLDEWLLIRLEGIVEMAFDQEQKGVQNGYKKEQ